MKKLFLLLALLACLLSACRNGSNSETLRPNNNATPSASQAPSTSTTPNQDGSDPNGTNGGTNGGMNGGTNGGMNGGTNGDQDGTAGGAEGRGTITGRVRSDIYRFH